VLRGHFSIYIYIYIYIYMDFVDLFGRGGVRRSGASGVYSFEEWIVFVQF